MALNIVYGKMRNLLGENLENVENITGFGNTFDSAKKNYVVQYCGKRQREECVPLGVRSMLGKANLENLENILSWLKDDNVYKIGVFGMGGCGKTTLAIHVYNQLLQSEFPDVLVWVTVEMDFDVHKLQMSISNAVGLDLQYEKDDTRRAAKLHKILSERKYILFLDNLWDHFSFEKVGIPYSGMSKVIVMTRIWSVCRRIGCQRTIKISMLSAFDAWELFCTVLGHGTLAADGIGHIAQLVCQQCDGLPLAIVHLARGLRGVNNVSDWDLTLRRLKGFTEEQDFPLTKHLLLKLHSSYARLTSAHFKLSLLYCTLYLNDCKTPREVLIRLWISVGIIADVSSLQAQYDQGHTILNTLVDCCLLESSEDGHYVKMHNMIRNMAMAITTKKIRPRLLVRSGEQLTDLAEAQEFEEDVQAVSLARNYITVIPMGNAPNCPMLSVLVLQYNPLKNVPDSFFSLMPSLRLLDLSNTSIQRLPDSLCDLKNLRSLLLHSCQKLAFVPTLENLSALQVLDLGYCAIGQIPCGIDNLSALNELDLSGISKLKELDYELFTRLPALKRISCYATGSLHELQNLKSLETLDVTFHSISDYNNYVRSEHWRFLDSFYLQVGEAVKDQQQCSKVLWNYNNVVSFYGCSLAVERERLHFPRTLNHLYIDKCEGLGSLCEMFNWDDRPDLEDILDSENAQQQDFQGYIGECKNLNQENIESGLFPTLEMCRISRCHDIEKLFTPTQIMGLYNLEILEIRDCKELRELITKEDGDRSPCDFIDTVKLPNLKRLELTQLPLLSGICWSRLLCTSLQSIVVDHCPRLTRLPFFVFDDQQSLHLPMLEQIEGQEEWWNSLELSQTDAKLILQKNFRSKSSTHSASESGGDQSQI